MNHCVITGTDTDVGKTVFAAMLMLALDASYWKPIQAGVSQDIDTRTAQNLTGLPAERFFPERYILTEAMSPHRAAELDNVTIDVDGLSPPAFDGTLLIEAAGGLMVPLTRRNLQINMLKRWGLPVILCARTQLGTINHTLLSLEALWSRGIPVHGVAFIGPDMPDTISIIQEQSGVKVLGRLPFLPELNAKNLLQAFHENFVLDDFATMVVPARRMSA